MQDYQPVASCSNAVLSPPLRALLLTKPLPPTPPPESSDADEGPSTPEPEGGTQGRSCTRERSSAPSPRKLEERKRALIEAELDEDEADRDVAQRRQVNVPKKKRKMQRRDRNVENTSRRPLRDHLKKGLDYIVLGMVAGLTAGNVGEFYASPSNSFWKVLVGSGLTDRQLSHRQAELLPDQYSIGITVLIPNPSADVKKMSKAEKSLYVPALLRKVLKYAPRMLAINGLEICHIIAKYFNDHQFPQYSARTGRKLKDRVNVSGRLGLLPIAISLPVRNLDNSNTSQRQKIYLWTSPNTSNVVAQYRTADKIRLFTEMKRDLQSIKAGTLELSNDSIEVRSEDLLGALPPLDIDLETDSDSDCESGSDSDQRSQLDDDIETTAPEGDQHGNENGANLAALEMVRAAGERIRTPSPENGFPRDEHEESEEELFDAMEEGLQMDKYDEVVRGEKAVATAAQDQDELEKGSCLASDGETSNRGASSACCIM
ncbi:hypothetical protein JCM5350_003563 [Sporobolomyces pararoseus]